MKFDFSDYTVLITGGTRGIGKAVSEKFADYGARVIATYYGNEKAADQMREKMNDYKFEAVKFDVADYKQTEEFFKWLESNTASLEVLVNNAGIRKDSVVGMMSPEDWNSVISTNLTGTYNMSKFALLKMMQNRFGRIINITSPSGKMGFIGQANYAAAKAGQVAFAKSLSKEGARRGITVNCVSPGFIDTELISDLDDNLKKQYKAQVPLKRFGKPEEVASGICFLASPEASYITGSVLEITGGI